LTRFAHAFERLRREGACGLFPYLMAGFPDVPTSRALAEAALAAGADGFEIGVPFSDPLADGTTLQRANARALEGGATIDTALDLARLIRERSPETPVSLMSYYNPLRQRGDRQVAADFAAAGVDGVIAADLPAEESSDLRLALGAEGVALIPLVAPTSPPARIRAMTAVNPEWIYCVALVGVTGARQDISDTLESLLNHVRAETSAPLVVGFGISQPDHVRRVACVGADGVIVASALADLIERSADPVAAAATYLREMKDAAIAVRQP
jgi:tryptophan synthase alpha chain